MRFMKVRLVYYFILMTCGAKRKQPSLRGAELVPGSSWHGADSPRFPMIMA